MLFGADLSNIKASLAASSGAKDIFRRCLILQGEICLLKTLNLRLSKAGRYIVASVLCVSQSVTVVAEGVIVLEPYPETVISVFETGATCVSRCEVPVAAGETVTLSASTLEGSRHLEFSFWKGSFTDEDDGFFNAQVLQIDTDVLFESVSSPVIESRFLDPEPYAIEHPLLAVSFNASADWQSFDLFEGVDACNTPGSTGDPEKDRLSNPVAQWDNMQVLDLNGDGLADIVLPAHCGFLNFDIDIGADKAGYLFVFLQDANGNFVPSNLSLFGREEITLGDFMGSIQAGTVADMNRDGYPDILFKNDRDNGVGDNGPNAKLWWQEYFDTSEPYPPQQISWMGEQFLMLSTSAGSYEIHQIGWNTTHNRAYPDAAGDWYIFTDPHERAAAIKLQNGDLVDVFDEIFLVEEDDDGANTYNYRYASRGPHLGKNSFSFGGLDGLTATLGVSGFRYAPDNAFLELRVWEDDMDVDQGHCKPFYREQTCSGPKVVSESMESDDFFMFDLGGGQMGLSVYGNQHTGLGLWNFDRILMDKEGSELLIMKIPYSTMLDQEESGSWPLWLAFREDISGQLAFLPLSEHPFYDPEYSWSEQINTHLLDRNGQFHNGSNEDDRFPFQDLNGDGLQDYTTWRPVTFGNTLMLQQPGYPIPESGASVVGRDPSGFRYNTVFINNGQGKFVKIPIDATSFPFPAGTYQQMLRDLNGDGAADLLTLVDFPLRHALNNRTHVNRVGLLINYGTEESTPPPSQPNISTVETGDRSVNIFVSAAEQDGGSVAYFSASCSDGINTFEVEGSNSPLTLTGLFNGLSYTCAVRAVGVSGEISSETTVSGIVSKPPGSNVYRVAVEEPVTNEIHTGVGNLRGWAVATEGVTKIEIYVDGKLSFEAPYGGSRRDVGTAFPDVEGAGSSGYSLAYNYSDLASGRHSVIAQAYSDTGATFASSAIFEVVKFPSFIRGEGAVKLGESSCTLSNDEISLFGASVLNELFDVRLKWRPAEQGFEIVEIR